jgi:glycosyltransferase involved in cell wall biosynthesis
VVAFSLLTLVPGEVGGSEIYARELLRALARRGTLDFRVLEPGAATTRLPRPAAFALLAARPPLRGVDVVHYPLTVPWPRAKARVVVTLHDVQHLDLPELFSPAERRYRSVAYDRAARRADRTIVISDFVRARAIERLGLDPARVHVTPLGVDHAALTPGVAPREPFLLYPARPWRHKNHARLFEALARIRTARPELRLILTGGGEFGSVPEGVEVLGHVARGRLVELLRTASALVFPSLYEGFGLPPLEAMACGCPVACSNAAALPEVVGDAALLFDPTDPEEIAAAVLDVLADPGPWRERGLERAARYSWDETARLTEDVYSELLP